jgi:uncharacterized paraquat-inducible protein A
MKLRKCPGCKDMVGAESDVCPRCGASYRALVRRRWAVRIALAAVLVWAVGHYLLRAF